MLDLHSHLHSRTVNETFTFTYDANGNMLTKGWSDRPDGKVMYLDTYTWIEI